MTVEMSRPVDLSKVAAGGLRLRVSASEAERDALARRMGIPAIHALDCSFLITRAPDGETYTAHGTLTAEVVRICVVSAEEFAMPVEEVFTVRFVPEGTEQEDPDPDDDDEIPYTGTSIDAGEVTSEQLALALDPYPRMPGAVPPEIEDDDDSSPFAALRRRTKSGDA
jgi:uncharacterized metal-binding protein YceD (DUF177 family)